MDIINDSFFILNMDLRVNYNNGIWMFNQFNETELKRLNEVFTIFKTLYRHCAKEYFRDKQEDKSHFLIKGFEFR